MTALLSFGAEQLRAGCGLQACPHPATSGARGHDFSLTVHHTAYDLGGFKGHYEEARPRWQYRSGLGTTVGAFVPVIANSPDIGHSKTGLGNPVVFGEVAWPAAAGRLAAGSQFEIPWGRDDHGLAAEHAEWLPYVSLHRPALGAAAFVQTGLRLSLSESHGHAPAGGHSHGPLAVNPHEDEEFVYRFGLSGERSRAPRGWEAFFDGQHAFDSDTGFLTAGGALRWRPSAKWDLHIFAEAPLTEPSRFEHRFGVVAMFAPKP
jgi:hypothetical protein